MSPESFTDADFEEALELSVTVIEILTDSFIRKRLITYSVVLGRESFWTEEFPIEKPRVKGLELEYSEDGEIIPNLPLNSYELTYSVGMEYEKSSQLTLSAIANVAAFYLEPSESLKETILLELSILKDNRDKVKKDREDAKTH